MQKYANIFLIASILFIAACSVSYLQPSKNAFILDTVPFFPQDDFQCGPSSLASVLNFHGVNVTPNDISAEIYSPKARGTLTIDMILYLQKRGLKADQYSGSMSDLKDKLRSGYPMIVMADFGFSSIQMNHFMVVTGYDNAGIVVNSGKSRSALISSRDFISAWQRTKNWTLWIKK
ncbi:MAG: C39 family peptidase [Nitrospirae bacterium]|nr:C39 family peptidase [Nitrospirota bacterium]